MPRPMSDPHSRRKRSRRQERATAKELRGRVQPGSGNVPVRSLKEDAVSAEVLVQCKLTDKKSFPLKEKEFLLTTERALRMSKMPVWRVQFPEADLAVVRWQDYVALLKDAGMLCDES